MNINNIKSTPAFKGDYSDNVEVIPVEQYQIIDAPDQFIPTVKKTPEEKIMDCVKAVTISGIAIPTGLKAGEKITAKLEGIIKQFLADFSDPVARNKTKEITEKGIKNLKDVLKLIKNFNTLPIEELSKRGKALGKWAIGGTIAATLIYLGTKDDNKDGQSDLLTAVKTYISPGPEPLLLE